MRESSATTDLLEKIRAMFAAAQSEGVGRINNGLLAGVLAELIDRRCAKDGEKRHVPVRFGHIKKAADLSRAQIAIERVIAALSEFHAALKEELEVNDDAEAMADYLFGRLMAAAQEIRDKLAGTAIEGDSVTPHSATPSGDPQPGVSDAEREAIEDAGGIVSD